MLNTPLLLTLHVIALNSKPTCHLPIVTSRLGNSYFHHFLDMKDTENRVKSLCDK
ncbi:unnamed protein product [Moneuplotes crassus]|uniref:Uncharacterized protein n=1 Tax=Euplotes crassus TaxID=5936 RepID=A0AAD1X6P3_EUPCR|nr:unnamed protein product [Moneuplotes crassus]